MHIFQIYRISKRVIYQGLYKLYDKFLPEKLIKISKISDFKKITIFHKKKYELNEKHLDVAIKANMYTQGYEAPEGYYVELKNIHLYSDSGLIEYNKKIIEESGMDSSRIVAMKNIFRKIIDWKPNIKKNFKEKICTSVIHLPLARTNNYHWFIECLGRFYLLEKFFEKKVTVLVHHDIPKYQLETLRFCIPNKWDICKLKKNNLYEIDKFIFPSFVHNHMSGYLDKNIIKFIQNKVWDGYKLQREDNNNLSNIYISRGKATKRSVLNEIKLKPVLDRFKFKIIYAEDLDYKDQVKLFLNAKTVISAHGSGLVNIIFSKNANIIELQPKTRVKNHYSLLAMANNLKYHVIYLDVESGKVSNTNMYVSEENVNELNNILYDLSN